MKSSIILLFALLAITQCARLRAEAECWDCDIQQAPELVAPAPRLVTPVRRIVPTYVAPQPVRLARPVRIAPQYVAPQYVAPARRYVAPPVSVTPIINSNPRLTNITPKNNNLYAPSKDVDSKVIGSGHKVADMTSTNKNNYLQSQPRNYYVDARKTNYIDARRNNMVSNKDGDDINVYDAHRKNVLANNIDGLANEGEIEAQRLAALRSAAGGANAGAFNDGSSINAIGINP